ncbi:MAG: YybH family protein [Candidatus Binatia bacterium]
MMQRSGFRLATLALAALLTTPALAADDVDEARKAIDTGNALLMKAIDARDEKAISALYTSDAVVLPPDAEMIVGSKTGIEALWKESFAQGMKSFKLETVNVERSGDVAVETGRFTGKVAPEGKPEMTIAGKYLVVWKKDKDGTWKLHRDIWNSDPAPAAPETTASAR